MMSKACLPATIALLAALCLAASAAAEVAVLVEIDDLEPGDVEIRGFELEREQEVEIEARALGNRTIGHKSIELAGAWILDAGSREVVWEMEQAEPDSSRRGFRDYDEKVRLDAGTYEVYYATYATYDSDEVHGWWEGAARQVAQMFGWGDSEDYEEAVGELRLEIRGDGRATSSEQLAGARAELREEALVALTADGDDDASNRGFALEQPMELLVYAVGELGKEQGHDYGWIVDAATRKKVWTFTWDGSEQAGGAKKNRVAHDTVRLPAGRYAAYYVTDDSHSPEHWNDMPPHDPSFWGLTLWLKDPRQRQFATLFDYQHLPDDERVIVELTRMRDKEHRTQGFTLEQAMDVRIYAVGEGTGHGMADYGWLMDARTRQKVWAMKYEHTEPAGGSKKNRLADVVVRLEPGSYVVGFVTDGSHAYRDWNATPPTDQDRWGISLFGGEGFDPQAVAEYREDEDPGLLARISRVKSDSHRRREFTLDGKTEVSVYALGEGTHGEMHDYAWIEDSEGQVVWEMTYPMTGGAGGASKNRLYQGTLELPPGDYVLHYKSDDSHAYRDWNESPPHDPDAWGVQVARVD